MRCVRVVRLRVRIQVGTVKSSLGRLVGLLLLLLALLLLLLKVDFSLLLLLLLLLSLKIHHQWIVVARVQDVGRSRCLNRRELAIGATTRARGARAGRRNGGPDTTVGLEAIDGGR